MNMKKCIYVKLMVFIKLYQERRNANILNKTIEND